MTETLCAACGISTHILEADAMPVTDQPATDQPATDQPATDQPATNQPATNQPATDQPATDQPDAQQLRTQQSGTQQYGVLLFAVSTSYPLAVLMLVLGGWPTWPPCRSDRRSCSCSLRQRTAVASSASTACRPAGCGPAAASRSGCSVR